MKRVFLLFIFLVCCSTSRDYPESADLAITIQDNVNHEIGITVLGLVSELEKSESMEVIAYEDNRQVYTFEFFIDGSSIHRIYANSGQFLISGNQLSTGPHRLDIIISNDLVATGETFIFNVY